MTNKTPKTEINTNKEPKKKRENNYLEKNSITPDNMSPSFLSVINSMADFAFCKNLDGVYIGVNESLAQFFGRKVEDVIGKTDHQLFDEERANIFVNEDKLVIKNQSEWKNNDWVVLPDGKKILLETIKTTLRNSDGTIIGVLGISRDITQRFEKEETINEKIADADTFFGVTNDLMMVAEPSGKILKVNNAWAWTLGYDSPDLLSQSFYSFIHPEDQEISLQAIHAALVGNSDLEFINRMRTKNGDWKNFEWRGKINHFRLYLASRDITKRIQDESTNQQQQAQLGFRHKFEETLTTISTKLINLPIDQIDSEINGVLGDIGELMDVDRSYVFFFNDVDMTMTNSHEWVAEGISPEKENLVDLPQAVFPWWLKKLRRFEVINVPDVSQLPKAAHAEREILESQDIKSILVVPLISDNDLIGFLGFDSVKKSLTWSQDSVLLIKMVSDIISNALMRQKYQKELAQSEKRKSALLKAVPDMIFRISRDGMIVDIKPSIDDTLNNEFETYVGKSIESLLPPNRVIEILSAINEAVETNELQNVEFLFDGNDSRRVVEARIQYSGNNEVTAIVRDISERARLEQIKSDFINKATHELRTPIATMMLMANLMDGSKTEAERIEFWDILKGELDREKLLIDDILTAGKMEGQQPHMHYKMINMCDLFNDLFTKLEIQAKEKSIHFEHSITRDEGVSSDSIMSDEISINQIFGNLIGNALKFTPSGGSIKVKIHFSTENMVFTIQDTGIGIPAEDVPFLFSRFFRGTNAIEKEIQGTGIGLFIVKSLLDRIGGTIQLNTRVGKGTKFTVTLPRAL